VRSSATRPGPVGYREFVWAAADPFSRFLVGLIPAAENALAARVSSLHPERLPVLYRRAPLSLRSFGATRVREGVIHVVTPFQECFLAFHVSCTPLASF